MLLQKGTRDGSLSLFSTKIGGIQEQALPSGDACVSSCTDLPGDISFGSQDPAELRDAEPLRK